MKADLYSKTGTKTQKSVELQDEVFKAKINEALLNQAIYVYQSNQRESNAHTKDRSEVRGGGRKPWRQKGTGRARHGSSRSPIWTGGGVTFGPKNINNYKKSLSKKMRKAAIRSALSYTAKEGEIRVVEGFDLPEAQKTQAVAKAIDKMKLEGKTLIIQANNDQILFKSASSIDKVDVEVVNALNVFNLLKYNNLLILEDAVEKIHQFWGKVEAKTTKKTK